MAIDDVVAAVKELEGQEVKWGLYLDPNADRVFARGRDKLAKCGVREDGKLDIAFGDGHMGTYLQIPTADLRLGSEGSVQLLWEQYELGIGLA